MKCLRKVQKIETRNFERALQCGVDPGANPLVHVGVPGGKAPGSRNSIFKAKLFRDVGRWGGGVLQTNKIRQ